LPQIVGFGSSGSAFGPPCPRPATTLIHDKWRELFDGPT
jgi:hypothetical protein